MKALRSHVVGGPESLTIDELDSPLPGPGEVRIAVRACGINFPDTLIIRDLYQYKPEPGTREFPLALISPALATQISSTFGQLREKPAEIEISAQDAAARGITSGAAVRVWNQLGEVRCVAKIESTVRPGVLVLAKGFWRKHTANGHTANALIPETLADLGGQAAYNDARVEIAPL